MKLRQRVGKCGRLHIGLSTLAFLLPSLSVLAQRSDQVRELAPEQTLHQSSEQIRELAGRRPSANTQPVLQPRQFSAVAHDPQRGLFLLFGGTDGSARFDDTWILSTSGWKMQTLAQHPSARISSAAAYDGVRKDVILFGGRVKQAKSASCSPGAAPAHLKTELFCADTWAFDGGNWLRKALSVSPSAREGHAMAFDAARRQIVLFGGTVGGKEAPLSDTWLWDGTRWKQAFPVHHPPGRFWHSLAYDPVRQQTILFGGDNGVRTLNDTWLWNGKDWEMAKSQVTPPGLLSSAAMDFDATHGRMVLFSGSAWSSRRTAAISEDAWGWDGAQWKKLAVSSFSVIRDFSNAKSGLPEHAILANGTPSVIWVPAK